MLKKYIAILSCMLLFLCVSTYARSCADYGGTGFVGARFDHTVKNDPYCRCTFNDITEIHGASAYGSHWKWNKDHNVAICTSKDPKDCTF